MKAVELATESGASAWITTLPLKEFGFDLHKQDLPTTCVCGSCFSVNMLFPAQEEHFRLFATTRYVISLHRF